MKQNPKLLPDQNIEYSIRESKRAKRLRIAVYADHDVIVTKPQDLSLEILRKFVESKRSWITKKLEQQRFQIAPELKENSRMHFLLHKIEARNLIKYKLDKWNEVFEYEYRGVNTKQLKSRWGSCTNDKILNFNYKIIFLPELMQDYIVVHELCHLKHQNHSKKFWDLVKKTLPNYLEISEKIKNI